MGDAAILISSSLLKPQNRRPYHNSKHSPLLSNVRSDLTAPRLDAAPVPSTRRLLKYYARLASKLAGDGKLDDFLMIAESVLTSAAAVDENAQFVARVSTKMVAAGVCMVLKEGRIGEVLEFLDGVDRLGICAGELVGEVEVVGVLKVECRRLVEEKRLVELVEFVEALAGYGFSVKDIIDPVDVLKLFVGKSDSDMALRFASIFPHSQLLFCTIIEEFGKKQDMASALRAFEACKEQSGGFNMFVCRSIIDVCGLCGDFLKSRTIFKELLARRIQPNIYVFNSLMNVNAHDLNYTLHISKHVQDLGVTMDMTSYNILLKACSNAKRIDLAQDIYKEIKHMASKGELQLDVFTYSTMIKVFADAKMWKMALNVKEDMLLAKVSPNVVTWSSLISACANAGLLDRAMQMLEEMLMAGCEPNTQCCNIILDACVKSYQYDKAFRLFYSWKETGIKISHTTKGTTKGERCDTTDKTYIYCIPTENDSQLSGTVEVVPFRPTVTTFNILMKACGTDYYRAKALMDEMKTMGLSPNHISWCVLIDIYGISQNTKGALEAFRTMQGVGIKLDVVAFTTAIKACVENKKLKTAFSLFEEMKRHRVQPNLVTYNTLLRARRKYGSLHEVQQCLAVYQEMREAGYNANDYYLKELIEEWCEGVIRNNQDGAQMSIQKKHMIGRSKKTHGLLLEKVAAHLQKDVGDNQAIDIRGLTQVEARIVVLSVLWKIRESYRTGKLVEEDMIIISGAMRSTNHELKVQRAIVKVLQDELGLDVATGYGNAYRNHEPSPQCIESSHDYKHIARRPQDLGVIKVSSKSLCNWLQKKEGHLEDHS